MLGEPLKQIAAHDAMLLVRRPIAATAMFHNLAVVTPNVKDFEGTGILAVDAPADSDS
ncbi:hypothetical protein J5N58_15120 [Rhizobium cremeum]|uniref:hypothetical protein n=1 Tax=Rhizobium cremeum TaxID=2813827 RepID=UPI001FD54184|nr:hypothetical protein [Rhizobium cremeum]MCJ7995511.1 hypothetical protein [Rhizobium cremeum]MCJ8001009.1 hypothetical protein [Rhizobium cremeum]